jgi:hypothetical protein
LLVVENDEQNRIDVGKAREKPCLDVVDGTERSEHQMMSVATVATLSP